MLLREEKTSYEQKAEEHITKMAHFYGVLQGRGKDKTLQGNKKTGLTTYTASYAGAIQVDLIFDEKTGKDKVRIEQIPWIQKARDNRKQKQKLLYEGILGE